MPTTEPGTYAYCRICGHTPNTPENQTVKYWDPDDGWIFGALCPGCLADYGDRKPRPTDFATRTKGEAPDLDSIQTDEDITDLL